MANTGVTVSDDVISQFNEVKLHRVPIKFATYKIQDGVIVRDVESESDQFEAFLQSLPPDDCRYAVYDMNFTTTDGRPGNKLVLVSWSPDSAKTRPKMLYAGSKDALIRALVGISVKINATDLSELTEEIVADACRKFA